MIEGSGSGAVPLTNGFGSGSRRPKSIGTDPDPQHLIQLLKRPIFFVNRTDSGYGARRLFSFGISRMQIKKVSLEKENVNEPLNALQKGLVSHHK
jgi:hypothetical protein